MTKEEFLFRLQGASFLAMKFAENYVKNKLYTEFRYDVTLIEPENRSKEFSEIKENEAVDLIFKEGKVPTWIDISVSKVTKKETIINLLCSKDYSKKKEDLYYTEGGSKPFGIKSPNLPIGYKKGEKFKLK
ncbi:hypothetical protein [Pseudotenacibaculum haliotis]|uniref:Uncharacterized protein n=1 Tax=Pseudotenacibaculum haliotis TaxID=1862138 RepID=A0ABW5LQS9_9FLAO